MKKENLIKIYETRIELEIRKDIKDKDFDKLMDENLIPYCRSNFINFITVMPMSNNKNYMHWFDQNANIKYIGYDAWDSCIIDTIIHILICTEDEDRIIDLLTYNLKDIDVQKIKDLIAFAKSIFDERKRKENIIDIIRF